MGLWRVDHGALGAAPSRGSVLPWFHSHRIPKHNREYTLISDIEYFCLFRNIAGISDKAGANQLASIWGKTYPDKNLQLADIKEMQVLVRNCIG